MKKNLPVTQRDKPVGAGIELVSATDVKGVITHANQAFVDISGFELDELVGTSHNVVRHPDMPPAAFQNLWDTLKTGRPWMGVVKNRCKDGDHYWVDAFVTPTYDDAGVAGYESVRVAPEAATVGRAERLYRQLWGESSRLARFHPTLAQKLTLGFAAAGALGFGAASLLGFIAATAATAAWIGTTLAGGLATHWLTRGLRDAVADTRKLVDNPAMQYLYTGRHDEIGTLLMTVKTLQAQLRTVLGRIRESAAEVSRESGGLCRTATQMNGSLQVQQHEIDMIATAVEEMSASVQEVARSATMAAAATEQTNQRATAGQRAVDAAISSSQELADSVAGAAETIASLEQDSEAIGAVLVVIRGIAEQTNLLALNAAIEAARAGEQGRGYAVVADEVRTLASRTQSSTAEIEQMIDRLQSTARTAVKAMTQSRRQVDDSVANTQQIGSELQEIFNQVASLEEMGRSIATAAEEQSSVSQEISRNVHRLSGASIELAQGGETTREIGEQVSRRANELESLIRRFRA
jgi:aerotaxis receptor